MLEINGFASFRESTQVDFTGADFFALVGPTGSGKSTVIDAMTFALYGSVPRWDRKGKVSLALAPTVARGTVKLVFEVEGQRYVVARELRRASGQAGQVSQRAASLERLSDPESLARPGDASEVLAGDLGGVTDAVERLLGLAYEDFCQCVVLPQGQFANFLHARTGDRQEILLRLLGAEHYRKMMERANQRASSAAQRADTLTETLTTFSDATQEAEDAARAAEKTLASISQRVEAARPQIQSAGTELAAAEAELARLEEERSALAAVQVPHDIASLDADLGTSRSALQAAQAAEKLAEETDRTSRAELARGPQRAPLELAHERRAERAEHVARLPSLQDGVAKLSVVSRNAETQVSEASSLLEKRRAEREEAVHRAEAAVQQVDGLSAEHTALNAVSVPAGTDQLDERRRAAADVVREASAVLRSAEQADSEARRARNDAVPEALLAQTLQDLNDLGDLLASLAPVRASLHRAREQRAAADAALESADAAREQRQQDLDDARRANSSADLRPHLIAGEPCPVCEQTVSILPAPLHAPALEGAQAHLDAAITAATSARKTARTAASAEAAPTAELDTLTKQRARWIASLTTALVGPLANEALTATADLLSREPEPASLGSATAEAVAALDEAQARRGKEAIAEVSTRLQARRSLDEAADAAAASVETARTRLRSAQQAQDESDNEIAAARAALRVTRDPLVQLGAPPVDDTALSAAWMRLARWAADQAQKRALNLAEARHSAQAAESQRDAAQAAFAGADTHLARLRAAATAAAREEQQARARLAQVADRISDLDKLLQTAPGEKELAAQLALRDKLVVAAAAAEQRLIMTRTNRTNAEQTITSLEQAEASAFARLSAARDPLVALGAPVLEDAGLLAAWIALAAWAADQAAFREQDLSGTKQRVANAHAKTSQLTRKLSAALAKGGIELAPEAVASGASSAVAGALERARAATKRIAERCAQATDLTARREAAQDEQQVARQLGDLLRSDRFPRWLVAAAVNVLVADASANLAVLSGGQFDLTYDDGEFFVIDHTDADSRRSVRTLSGGETFQASLALALALSSQISGLAAAGAARLDSIFLDEGFGTLDPETLEVVATTLETLAQGKRMVGVVTHVAALAERVPVRFIVSRDARTSSVIREGFTAMAGEA
jgi:exonuclease SbcC